VQAGGASFGRSGGSTPISATSPFVETLDPASRALLDALDEPALVVEGRLVLVANEAAKALLGAAIEHGDVRIAIRHPQALEFVLAGAPGDIDFTGVGAVGRPWRLSARPVGPSQLLLRLFDRSESHSAEKLRVDFVANASHELKTPLTAVLGYAESIEEGDLDSSLAAKFAGTIRKEAKRMLGIIEDLMSLSRIEADRYIAPTGSIDVAAIVRSATAAMVGSAEKSDYAIQLDLDEEMPPVAGDHAQIAQLVENLVGNAIRYGCAKPACEIKVSAAVEDRWIRLDVSDSGPGIPRDHLPFLTRRFYRVDEGRSRATGGTGLGLAIVKHIVERHRGTLSIESTPGEGTRVTVKLPKRPA
jgi:two-component system phosphate regulon sensor histidine kinase PhoR